MPDIRHVIVNIGIPKHITGCQTCGGTVSFDRSLARHHATGNRSNARSEMDLYLGAEVPKGTSTAIRDTDEIKVILERLATCHPRRLSSIWH